MLLAAARARLRVSASSSTRATTSSASGRTALFHQVLDGCASCTAGLRPVARPGRARAAIPNPARVVYRSVPWHYNEAIGLVYRGAYWVSGMEVAFRAAGTSRSARSTRRASRSRTSLHAAGPGFGPSGDRRSSPPVTRSSSRASIACRVRHRHPRLLLPRSSRISPPPRSTWGARASRAVMAYGGSRVEVSTDTAAAVTLTALRPSAPIRVNGAPVGSADANGGVTVSIFPAGEHTIVALPEPSPLLGLTAGAMLLAGLRARRRARLHS